MSKELRDPADLLPFSKEIVILPGEKIPIYHPDNEIPLFGKLRPKKAKRRSTVIAVED